ncbi:hypothetical protein Pmani_028255 [Petrolisthes manimaculis]|uniref:Carboxylic ester hydrolase n=1 Tax=Petrolisthes manimaculis TaxID=1843537 RepID=A0AAE1P2H1_9EUCA|nr:hypothetical protein Pmani_028255 [Petrolisthes manimaculis]
MRVLVVFLMAGVCAGLTPLEIQERLREKIQNSQQHQLPYDEVNYEVNYGLQGVVTQELWDQYTVFDDNPPTFVHPSLNGKGSPTTVVGKNMLTINNREIYAFQGIKYGEAMTGDLRFKRTEPAGVYWNGDTLEADHLGFKCPQKAMFGGVPSGDEDCLNLNVYTPKMPTGVPGENPLPVMLFIHGGAFISGDSSLYLPTKLLDKDVILVVIHYRLGNLGFFSLDNDDAPGNAGLWDQIESLKWVQDNIGGFGGDTSRVTIFGESAGSASVNWLLLLPEANDLFHGVIGESGSALEHWSTDPDPIGSSQAIGEYMKCPNVEDLDKLYECFRDMDAGKMALDMSHFVSNDRKHGQMGFRGAAPVVETNVTEPLITKQATDYFIDGDVKNVPLIIGANKHEGSFVLSIMYFDFLLPNNLADDKQYVQYDMLDDLLNCFGVVDVTHGISESLQDAYISGLDASDFNASSPGYVDLAGVLFLKAGSWNTAKLHANYTDAGSYHYSFDFESDDTMFRWLFMGAPATPFRPGVTHSDELMYLFSFPAIMEDQQLKVMDRMVQMWTNFAIYGKPTIHESGFDNLEIPVWKPLQPDEHHFMLIQDKCTLESEYPDRWHIALQEDGLPTTENPPVTSDRPTWVEYNDLDKEREAYMISMIVFVVTTACMCGIAGFIYFKKRG